MNLLLKERLHRFAGRVFRSRNGLWFPEYGMVVPRKNNVLGLLTRPDGRYLIPAANLVTLAGDVFYAQRGAGESPDNAFGVHELATGGTVAKGSDRSDFSQIAGTEKAHSANYPQTDDEDSDNPDGGADVVTYRAFWSTGDFDESGISHGLITNESPGASEPILTGYAFAASFDKTSDDTLTLFVNHEVTGA